MLDEAALRKPDGRFDVPVKLGDGQVWSLPRPIVEFRMSLAADDVPKFRRSSLGFGDGYMDALQAFYDAEGAESLNRLAYLACRLLRLNYDLDAAPLADLLPYRPADPANVEMWQKITGVATGTEGPPEDQEDDI